MLAVCGDGKLATTEECDLGGANVDRPAFQISQPSTAPFGTDALVKKQSAASFYNYFSASSHTGFEAPQESRTYMYIDGNSGRLHLFVTHGEDNNQPNAQVTMDLFGIPSGFSLDISDDPGEFVATGSSTAYGKWSFVQNSDGGVIGGLPFPGNWTIVITPNFVFGITTWGFVKSNLQRVSLKLAEKLTIQAFDSAGTCRKNCTKPRCGDGVLDGGEVCDDGNVIGGDGCASDCRTLN
jgi:cysteine-rich repeat protein